MSKEHLIRTVAIVVAFLGVGTAYLWLLLSGREAELPGVAGRLEGMLTVLTPAVLDATHHARVEKKRSSLKPPPPAA